MAELRIGHRGAAGHAPGNTLASIAAALRIGVDLVELDVQRTQDGHLIVLHDWLLQRSTTGRGMVSEHSLAEVRRLRTAPGDAPIPSLSEALNLVSGQAGLMLEIKTAGLAEDVYRSVGEAQFHGPVYYASFLHAEIRRIRSLDAAAKTIALLEGAPVDLTAFALQAGATHAGIALDSLSPQFVLTLHAAGVEVLAWTADDPEEIAFARRCGVDGIISNYPERLLA
jgi:glycerophosphoryl diester phosphodiesterase